MTEPVEEGNICPCCGTEFGYDDDLSVTYEQLRRHWIEQGMPWFSTARLAPVDWNPRVQLLRADYEIDAAEEADTETEKFDIPAFA